MERKKQRKSNIIVENTDNTASAEAQGYCESGKPYYLCVHLG